MLALDDTHVLRLADDIQLHSEENQDFYYAFNLVTGDQFRLNEPAYWVLENLDQGFLFAELLERFAFAYGLDQDAATKDLHEKGGRMKPKRYEKPVVVREPKMTFPITMLESNGKGLVCKQCSSCHGCR